MSLLNTDAEGFLESDFEVYLPKCWASNVHNLQRMKVKERVVGLARGANDAVSELGLKVDASSEIPSLWNGRQVKDQWAYWQRDAEASKSLQPLLSARLDLATRIKAPADYLKHVLLAVRMDCDVIEVGLRMSEFATVDCANLVGRANENPEELDAALAGLGDEITFDGQSVTRPALLAAAREMLAGERDWVIVGRQFSKEEVVSAGASISAAVNETLASLVPLYAYALWSPANDHIGAAAELNAFSERTRERAEASSEKREQKAQAHAQRAEQARARTSSKLDAEEAWRKLQASRRVSRPPQAQSPSAETRSEGTSTRENRQDRRPRKPTESRRKSPSKGRDASTRRSSQSNRGAGASKPSRPRPAAQSFNVGDRCRLTRGLLAGKEGEIKGQDKPGYYSVKVGVLEVKVSAHELEPLNPQS